MTLDVSRSSSTSAVNVHNFGTVSIDSPNYVAYLFDISGNSRYAPLDADLQEIALNIQNTDFGAQAQLLMIDLIRILAFIRKQNQEISTQMSNTAFSTAFAVAAHQREQASKQAAAERITAGVTIFQGVSEMGSGLYQIGKSATAYQDAKAEATAMHQNSANNTANRNGADADGPEEFVRPKTAPPAYTEKAGDLDLSENGAPAGSKAAEAKQGGSNRVDDGEDADVANDRPIDQKALDQHIQDKMRNFHSEMAYKMQVVSGLTQIISGIIKQFSAQKQMEAGNEQAMATIEQAFMQYVNTHGQGANEYAAEMREWVRGILDLLRSTEQARHHAAQTITQIA